MLRILGEHLVLVLLGALAVGRAIFVFKDECPPNEEYLICGPACEANCTNPDGPDICTKECVEGCFCNPGLLRDANGTCVMPDQCSVTLSCGENEEFRTCGSSCPATCEQPVPGPCDRACRIGCFCKGTTVRDAAGKCVNVEDCPAEPCLDNNEVYSQCQGACEPSCSDPDPACTKICMGGCVCAPGLLRSDDGSCVTLDKCGNQTADTLNTYINAINAILHL